MDLSFLQDKFSTTKANPDSVILHVHANTRCFEDHDPHTTVQTLIKELYDESFPVKVTFELPHPHEQQLHYTYHIYRVGDNVHVIVRFHRLGDWSQVPVMEQLNTLAFFKERLAYHLSKGSDEKIIEHYQVKIHALNRAIHHCLQSITDRNLKLSASPTNEESPFHKAMICSNNP